MDTPPKLYDYVMGHLRSKRIPQRRVATESGVPFSTLAKIAQGKVTDPSIHTVQRLADYFAATCRDEAAHTERGSAEHELQEAA